MRFAQLAIAAELSAYANRQRADGGNEYGLIPQARARVTEGIDRL